MTMAHSAGLHAFGSYSPTSKSTPLRRRPVKAVRICRRSVMPVRRATIVCDSRCLVVVSDQPHEARRTASATLSSDGESLARHKAGRMSRWTGIARSG
uniref:Uncharacterized protein n=1 Tax=uncultured marine virus TaxID=186617 RepID=A0A0F7L651_9VIRU|nr:hypothetical protein [uncultured marine virus]